MHTMRFTLAVAFASALSTLPLAWAQTKDHLPEEQHADAVDTMR